VRVLGPVSSQAVEDVVAQVARDAGCSSDRIETFTSVSTDEVRVFEKMAGSAPRRYQELRGAKRGLSIEYYRIARRVKIKAESDIESPFFVAVMQDIMGGISKLPQAEVYTVSYFEFPQPFTVVPPEKSVRP
jgi:hypothetical protein